MNTSSHRTTNYVIGVLLAWFLGALTAGWLGIFDQLPDEPPTVFALFFALPILFFSALYFLNTRFHDFANSISLPLVVGAHLWRFVGLGFLVAVLLRQLPAGFGIPEGFGDVIAAVFALPLALALHRKKAVRGYFIAWNIFGLVDLLSAIAMGVLYSEGSFGILRTDVSTALMTTFPVSVIPTFFVPLFILLHVLALLRRNEVATTLGSAARFARGTA